MNRSSASGSFSSTHPAFPAHYHSLAVNKIPTTSSTRLSTSTFSTSHTGSSRSSRMHRANSVSSTGSSHSPSVSKNGSENSYRIDLGGQIGKGRNGRGKKKGWHVRRLFLCSSFLHQSNSLFTPRSLPPPPWCSTTPSSRPNAPPSPTPLPPLPPPSLPNAPPRTSSTTSSTALADHRPGSASALRVALLRHRWSRTRRLEGSDSRSSTTRLREEGRRGRRAGRARRRWCIWDRTCRG